MIRETLPSRRSIYDYPISHSLVTVFGLGAFSFFAGTLLEHGSWQQAWSLTGYLTSSRNTQICRLCPDGPYSWAPVLRNSMPASMIVEALLFVVGVVINARITTAADWKGRVALQAFMGFRATFCLLSASSGPPPMQRQVCRAASPSGFSSIGDLDRPAQIRSVALPTNLPPSFDHWFGQSELAIHRQRVMYDIGTFHSEPGRILVTAYNSAV